MLRINNVNQEEVFREMRNIDFKIECLSNYIEGFNKIEFQDKFKERCRSQYEWYNKYKYKEVVFVVERSFDSHLGSYIKCDIHAPITKYEIDKILYKGDDITQDVENDKINFDTYDCDEIEFTEKEQVKQGKVCKMWMQDTGGFEYRWLDYFNKYRDEIEQLLFSTKIPMEVEIEIHGKRIERTLHELSSI